MSLSKEHEQSPKSEKELDKLYLGTHLCSFRTSNRRCQVIGAISNVTSGEIKERWCGWHWLGLSNPDSLQNFSDYKEFRDNERESYPQEWLHASLYIEDEISWQAILGKITNAEYNRYVLAKENEIDEIPHSKNPVKFTKSGLLGVEDDVPF